MMKTVFPQGISIVEQGARIEVLERAEGMDGLTVWTGDDIVQAKDAAFRHQENGGHKLSVFWVTRGRFVCLRHGLDVAGRIMDALLKETLDAASHGLIRR